jgi:aminopeptidase N
MRIANTPLVLIACLLTLPAAPAWSQSPVPRSNLELMANDHYTRSHDYDLIHQRIVVSRFNWDSTSFEGSVTTILVSTRPGLDAIILDEGQLLANTRVVDRAGRTLATSRSGDTLVVHPARPLGFGDTLVFTITYHGKVKSGNGLTWITNDGLQHRPDQIWSQGEDHSNHFWFPTYDFPNDKMTWELVATVPRNDLAISNGRLVSNVVVGNNRTMTWNQDTPSATYLVSLIVAPLAVVHDTWQGIPVDYYTYHEDSTRAWRLFHVTTDMIGTYSKLTGVRYPWAKYAQTTVADFFGGMENVSATTLVDWLPDARAYSDRPWYQYILIPHELAHQWFGDYVTTVNWANMWLNEGFAEFMPGQYWNEKLGAHAEQDYYADEYRQYLQIEGRRSMPIASLGSNNIYPKGALVLRMLKDYLGPERFWASVHRYLTAHAFGTATSDDLRQAVLDATGENLDWFWDEWIYAAGLPKFTVKATYDAPTSRLTLNVQQTQVDSFKADSTGRLFREPQAFRMPVAIRVAFNGGARLYHAEINAREQTITIDSVAAEPTMVVFDEGNRILKTLTFDQPVSWLAEQLRHDDNLWDRQWAIAQLARHVGDGDAGTALADAATHADYYLTRVEAVNALSAFPAAIATSALADAAKDTSAAVRSAAVRAMAKPGDTAVVRVAGDLFHHDSSYDVRAAALGTLVQADPAHAHDVLAAALAIPSYRDAIQSAAFQGIIQTNDTMFIDQVDALIAQEAYPAYVLATFGARGNARALDIVIRHLNDPRAAVRRWVANALSNTMARVNKGVAVARLQAAVAGITYPETRQQVTELIARLDKP